jgi:hypothetical protein
MATVLEKINKPWSKETVLLVRVDGVLVGLLTKFRDTRTVKNPWKAYAAVGHASKRIGSFYASDGGKLAALAAVLAAAAIVS